MTYCDLVFYSAIHAIARLIELAAPSLREVTLRLYCHDFSSTDSIIKVDWEPLILLGRSPTCPHIDLYIYYREFETNRDLSPEIARSLADDIVGLRELANRGVFSIKPETGIGALEGLP